MEKVQYYLDTDDQITVDGHTLSRLYLKEPLKEERLISFQGEYAVYGYDHKGKVYRGGYVESLDSLPTTTLDGDIAWVDEHSKVYGDTKISQVTSIIRSTIVDSQISSGSPWVHIVDSTIRNSTMNSDCRDSTIENSHCAKPVYRSEIKNSKITKNIVFDSKITDSQISAKNEKRIENAHLTNVKHIGGLSGTFSDINPGDIKMHPIYYQNGPFHETQQLIIGPDNKLALYEDLENTFDDVIIPAGDITKQELLDFLKQPTEKGTVGNAKSIEFVESLQTPEELEINDIVSGLSELDNLSNDTMER